MKKAILSLVAILAWFGAAAQAANECSYLDEVKEELRKSFPNNSTVNLVFHGHSVPAGYYDTPDVRTLDAYPYMTLRDVKQIYPYAVVNTIVTAIGGENSERGAARFRDEVLCHRPDVLFIDYSLNDTGLGLEKAREAWAQMIAGALDYGCKVILLTPSPDQRQNIKDPDNVLAQHARQVRALAAEYGVGLVDSYAAFCALDDVEPYMSHVNHPNERGHEMITALIRRWFE